MPIRSGLSRVVDYRAGVVAILVTGLIVGSLSYHYGHQHEHEDAAAEFVRRSVVRHTITREVLARYEDSMFGLATLFMYSDDVTYEEFVHATRRLGKHISGVQAFQWVPAIRDGQRAGFEAALRTVYPDIGFKIVDIDDSPARQASPAPRRPEYYPIAYVEPLPGNEKAVGFDLRLGPTIEFLEQARTTGRPVVSRQFRLVQEPAQQLGFVMIWPVFRPTEGGEAFRGFLQCVFRAQDFLQTVSQAQPETMLEMLFVDASEPDPSRQVMYFRAADEAGAVRPATIADFRGGLFQEHALTFGGRDWRVLYRPAAGWIEGQHTSMPLARSASLVLLATLVAGIVRILGRRTETIRRQVDERTAELAESRRQLESTLHALPGMAFRCRYDAQLTLLFVSEGARELTGWDASDFLSGAVHFRDCLHPDDIVRVRAATRAAVRVRGEVELEFRIRTRAGGEKWVLSRGQALERASGETIFEGLAIDITAQKEAEAGRLALERKLLEGQKLESLGLMAGGIAHDFNNLLSSILGNATLVRLNQPAGAPTDPQLRAIENASLRAADLCRQMLAYAGKGRFVIEATDLTRLTEEMLPLLNVSSARKARIVLRLAPGLPAVQADATQLRQIVMNLVLNAVDAIGDDEGEIAIATGVTRVSTAGLPAGSVGVELAAGEYVFLEVCDTGCGMTPEVQARIFDPFFTTKFAGRGLGLAAVLGIVRAHLGALSVESKPGAGSTFRLYLPLAERRAAKATAPAESAAWKHHGTVLVVEDEEPVRVVLVEMLRTFGLAAEGAADGTAGIARFRERSGAFDLVILDLLMPGLSGEETLVELRRIRPDVRVLLVSGYSERDISSRVGEGEGRLAFLAKPFTREALQQKLQNLLG